MNRLPPYLNRRLWRWGFIALIAAVYVMINYLFLGKMQLCLWRSLGGFPCPGCGLPNAGIRN